VPVYNRLHTTGGRGYPIIVNHASDAGCSP
jgi:hypothetical protein